MSDKGNIGVKLENGSEIWFYTHSNGSDVYKIVKNALARKTRWDNPSYLARIIFCEMIKDDIDGTTGFGISSEPCESDHTLLIVDCKEQVVRFEDKTNGVSKGSISFKDLVKRKDKHSVVKQKN